MSQTVKRRDHERIAQTQSLTRSDTHSRSKTSYIYQLEITRIAFDGLAFVLIAVAWLLLKFFVKPFRRAFLCSDLDLYRPEPAENVFPVWLLVVCAIVVPSLVIILSEILRSIYSSRKQQRKLIYKLSFGSKKLNVPSLVGNLYIFLSAFAFANVVNSFLTNLGKVSVGRLRPHFIPSCFNEYSYAGFCKDPNEWISNYTCIDESSSIFKTKDGAFDIRQSFPSGHTSTAFCGLIFLLFYIHRIWSYRNLGLFPYVFQMASFALASYIGFTRMSDNRHHATDVLAGSILGTAVAFVAFRYTTKFFKQGEEFNGFDYSPPYTDEV